MTTPNFPPLAWRQQRAHPGGYLVKWHLWLSGEIVATVYHNGDGIEVRSIVNGQSVNGNGVVVRCRGTPSAGFELARQRAEVMALVLDSEILADWMMLHASQGSSPPGGGNARQRRRWRRQCQRWLDARGQR